jgi:hypothetical protein
MFYHGVLWVSVFLMQIQTQIQTQVQIQNKRSLIFNKAHQTFLNLNFEFELELNLRYF